MAHGLLLAVLLTLVVFGFFWPIEHRLLLQETTVVQTIVNTLLGGTILLVSIIVSVASIGISEEMTSLGEQAERVDTALEFRDLIEGWTEHGERPRRVPLVPRGDPPLAPPARRGTPEGDRGESRPGGP